MNPFVLGNLPDVRDGLTRKERNRWLLGFGMIYLLLFRRFIFGV
jgi:hypothetical protein